MPQRVLVALPDKAVHLQLSRGQQATAPYPRITNDLHISIATNLHENVPLSSTVHRLSGPKIYALTQNTLKITVGCVVGVWLWCVLVCVVCWCVSCVVCVVCWVVGLLGCWVVGCCGGCVLCVVCCVLCVVCCGFVC